MAVYRRENMKNPPTDNGRTSPRADGDKSGEREGRYRSIFENMAAGCCVDEVIYRAGQPVDFRILEVNLAYERITGIPRERAEGALASELYGTEELPFFDVLVRVAETGEPASFEAYFPQIGKHLSVTVGSPGRGMFSTVFQDISHRKRLEEDLRERERLLASVMETQRELVCRYLPDTTLTFVNEAYCRAFGMTRDELLGKKFLELIQESEHSRIIDYLSGFSAENPGGRYDHPVRKKDGTVAWQEWVDNAILDSRNRIVEFQSAGRDITKRKQAEAALRESEARFRELTELLPEAVFEADREMNLTFANRKAFDLFGYSREDFAHGLNGLEMIVPEDRKRAREKIQRRLRSGKGGSTECTGQRKDETAVPILIHVSPIVRGGEVAGFRGVIVDLTERKRIEQELLQARKLESLGALAGGIAHDFNNALTAIMGNISFARKYAEEGSQLREVLSEAEAACVAAESLTKQLLTFSRGGDPVREPLHPGKLLREAAEFALSGSPVKCRFQIPDGLWPVAADRGQLIQVVSNLVINAAQATEEGGEIDLRAANVALAEGEVPPLAGGRYVRVEVEDRGVGIPTGHLDKIYDPYFTTKRKGNGLGLTTAYSIVTKHDGVIRAESEPGRGSTFFFYLPASETAPPAEEEGEEPGPGTGRILLMDDEESIRKMGRRILESLGYRAQTAADGEEAVAKFLRARQEGDPFAAVILDLTVPGGMGGKKTLEKLRELDPEVRAVVSSGYSTDAILADPGSSGFAAAIPKPYSIENMSRTLAAVLRGCPTNP